MILVGRFNIFLYELVLEEVVEVEVEEELEEVSAPATTEAIGQIVST